MNLFDNEVVNHIVAPMGRRRALRNLVFGAGAAAVTPLLGGVPGVSAATLGFNTAQEIKIHQLTGQALKNELTRIEAQPEFKALSSFLASKGLSAQKRAVEGLEIYTQSGNNWVVSHSFAFRYSGSATATVSYYQNAAGKSIGVGLNTGVNTKDVYEVVGSHVRRVGSLVDNGMTLTITVEGKAPFTVKKADLQKIYTPSSSDTGDVAIKPNSCACLDICAEVVAAGCGILGAFVECSAICLGPEDLPCMAICAAALAVTCAVGGIDCAHFCQSYC